MDGFSSFVNSKTLRLVEGSLNNASNPLAFSDSNATQLDEDE